MGINALHTALNGMRRFSTRFDHAAAKIAQVGLEPVEQPTNEVSPVDAPTASPTSDPMLDGMVEMMIAQRMFMANLRAAQTADDILKAATDLTE